ncbi:hypothetical protein SAMN05216525_11394 [Bradyrhizobium sp. Gha]|nr:hypothetical protein SAMN05216525_11394 [Bradyrhizobium sp. Gha]
MTAIKPIAVSPHTSECIAHGRIVALRSHLLPMTGNAPGAVHCLRQINGRE